MRDIWEVIKVFFLALLIAVILMVVIGAALTPMIKASCDAETRDIGLPHRWSFLGGCQVQEDGNWIPLINWRYVRQ